MRNFIYILLCCFTLALSAQEPESLIEFDDFPNNSDVDLAAFFGDCGTAKDMEGFAEAPDVNATIEQQSEFNFDFNGFLAPQSMDV